MTFCSGGENNYRAVAEGRDVRARIPAGLRVEQALQDQGEDWGPEHPDTEVRSEIWFSTAMITVGVSTAARSIGRFIGRG